MDGRWAQERRRKEPTLYDEYLNQVRPTHRSRPSTSNADPALRQNSTIRAVSPDEPDDESVVPSKTTQTFERDFLSIPASPTTSPQLRPQEQGSPKIDDGAGTPGRESAADRTRRQANASTVASDRAHADTRRRTMTLQSLGSDHGTSISGSHTRSRMGSLQISDSMTTAGHTSPPPNSSQGLPSSISQPLMSTYAMRSMSSASASVSNSAGQLPTPNARRTLHLMKTLCGRMSGNVAYRRNVESPWISVYCFIRETEGSLMYEAEFGQGAHKTLIPDLRGCVVNCIMEEDTGVPYIEVLIPRSSLEVQLRLASQSDLDGWFAALLCWQPMQPKGAQNRLAKPQVAQLSARPTGNSDSRQNSESSILREAPVIKVGQMVYWDNDVTFKAPVGSGSQSSRAITPRSASLTGSKTFGLRSWKRVSCTLRENGELKFFTEAEGQLVSTIQLSQLSRSAIQRLDPTVLDQEYSIAIYTQYTCGQSDTESQRPVFVSVGTSVLFEVWYVLLRAFTIPQLYGPKPSQAESDGQDEDDGTEDPSAMTHIDMFRMERGLSLSILEARLHHVERMQSSPDVVTHVARRTSSPRYQNPGGYYVEVHLDGEVRGKTQVKASDTNPFWSQNFDYVDLPAVLSSTSVLLKQRTSDTAPGLKGNYETRVLTETYGVVQEPHTSGATSGYTGITQDVTLGKVEIILEELDTQKKSEQWWTILNGVEQDIGTMLIRARAEETVILMCQEYEPLHRILHAFANGLTVNIYNAISSELKRLSETLVNIFQVSGQSTEWLMTLVEDEIDAHGKDTALTKARYNQRMGSVEQDSLAAPRPPDRELVVRDMNKNAALEANLLFRGNTLLTKALDIHMRRIGTEYLTTALEGIITTIAERDPECEVDPNRITNNHDMQKNWARLIALTGDVWNSIRMSAQKCPAELRYIFRHIKACAEDKYGDFLRSVSYSSVSGFLFLRFFCPAVLTPKLFGLLKEDPKPKAKRTFVLIAKSLQTLANMATFGSKEPWMEPMNSFLNSNRESFKRFIEEICSVTQRDAVASETNLSYSTPNAIKSRLPATSKEGFPSLPYLLDEGREYANLIELWMRASSSTNFNPRNEPESSSLVQFDQICKALQARTQECLSRAERAEQPTAEHDGRWEEVVDSLGGSSSKNGTGSQSSIPRLRTNLPRVDRSTDEGSQPSIDDGGNTPTAQREWESAPDGGAAAAAALLSRDRNPRSGFVIPSTSSASSASGFPGSPPLPPSAMGDANDHGSPRQQQARMSPALAHAWAGVVPLPPSAASPTPRNRETNSDSRSAPHSRPGSALAHSSGAAIADDSADEATSASSQLPRFGRGGGGQQQTKLRRGSAAAAEENSSAARQRVRDLVGRTGVGKIRKERR